ncbi:MAG TPA: acyltransferase family protein [Cellulomonas sp.]
MTTLQPAARGTVRPTWVGARAQDAPTVRQPALPPARPACPARPTVATASPGAGRPPGAPRRDPFVSGVRAVGTLLVVGLHWLMVEAALNGDRLVVGNALGHGWAWLLTWAQPLPVLFFAAGAAARYGLDRRPGEPGWRLVAARLPRMALPVGVLLAAWGALVLAAPALGLPTAVVRRAARIVPQPLWFLGVQLVLLALTPRLLRLLRRHGLALVAVLAGLAVLVDVVRFGQGVEPAGLANVLLVWAVPYAGGLVYADQRLGGDVPLPRLRGLTVRGALALVAVGALAATVALLLAGPYPLSLIGMPGDAISNLAPPTAPVVTFAVAQIAGALLARETIARRAARSRLVAWVDARSMGLYLWHLTAMFLVCGLVLLGAGRAVPEPWTWDWWTSRPGYLGAAALVLVALVALAGRAERALRWRPARARAGRGDRASAPAGGQASRRTARTAPTPPISTIQASATRAPVAGLSTVSVRS